MSSREITPSAVAEAIVQAVAELLAESHGTFREAVTGMSAEALSWRPDAPDTNSIVVLVSHSLDAERFMLNAALDLTVERDRAAQFEREDVSSQRLLEEIDASEVENARLLGAMTAEHLVALTARRSTRSGVAWLTRAAVHTREHAGQAMLTRDLALAALGGG